MDIYSELLNQLEQLQDEFTYCPLAILQEKSDGFFSDFFNLDQTKYDFTEEKLSKDKIE